MESANSNPHPDLLDFQGPLSSWRKLRPLQISEEPADSELQASGKRQGGNLWQIEQAMDRQQVLGHSHQLQILTWSSEGFARSSRGLGTLSFRQAIATLRILPPALSECHELVLKASVEGKAGHPRGW